MIDLLIAMVRWLRLEFNEDPVMFVLDAWAHHELNTERRAEPGPPSDPSGFFGVPIRIRTESPSWAAAISVRHVMWADRVCDDVPERMRALLASDQPDPVVRDYMLERGIITRSAVLIGGCAVYGPVESCSHRDTGRGTTEVYAIHPDTGRRVEILGISDRDKLMTEAR